MLRPFLLADPALISPSRPRADRARWRAEPHRHASGSQDFSRMLATCDSTVRGLRNSSRAISRLVCPDGHQPHDLDLPPRQAPVGGLGQCSRAETPLGLLTQRAEALRYTFHRRLRAQPPGGAVGGYQLLDSLLPPTEYGRGQLRRGVGTRRDRKERRRPRAAPAPG